MSGPLPPFLLRGDCLVELRRIPDGSVDSVVTDPPYGLEFMGKGWDGADGFRRSLNPDDVGRDNVFGRSSRTSPEYRAGHLFEEWTSRWAAECFRILKPGGHMLAFGGSRTWHRLAAGIEDAGFEIRDSIAWLYGSGFPKSLDVSKAIDKAAGAQRTVVGERKQQGGNGTRHEGWRRPWMDDPEAVKRYGQITAPATDAAREWEGWGTALKPAFEPIVVARKPLIGTVAANVLAHGTGALNIDGARIAAATGDVASVKGTKRSGEMMGESAPRDAASEPHAAGRWPANVILDESQAAALDAQAPKTGAAAKASGKTRTGTFKSDSMAGGFGGTDAEAPFYGELGGASRFFYCAKAPKSERPIVNGTAHPTVKPLALMRYLCRLVTPPAGVVVDPFAGSGATLEAAYLEGFESIGVELTPDYWPLIAARIERVAK